MRVIPANAKLRQKGPFMTPKVPGSCDKGGRLWRRIDRSWGASVKRVYVCVCVRIEPQPALSSWKRTGTMSEHELIAW